MSTRLASPLDSRDLFTTKYNERFFIFSNTKAGRACVRLQLKTRTLTYNEARQSIRMPQVERDVALRDAALMNNLLT